MLTFDLITDLSYYKSRRRLLILGLFIAGAIGMVSSSFLHSTNVFSLLILAACIVLIALQVKVTRQIKTASAQQKISLDSDRIVIVDKDSKVLQNFQLGTPHKISVNSTFELAQETGAEVLKELMGKGSGHSITLISEGREQRFDFIIDSHFKIVQLKKMMDQWRSKGCLVENAVRN